MKESTYLPRESWKSRAGFILAGLGSAIGLVNIWRFPYVVAEYGGAAFIAVYILFLLLIGFPVLVSEVLIGRTAKRGPAGALAQFVSRKAAPLWFQTGKGIIITGFLVSSFYSVVAGWIIGYLVEAVRGGFSQLHSVSQAATFFEAKLGSATWCVGYHLIFMVAALFILEGGVRRGIELANKLLMPLLIVLLLVVMFYGLTLPGALGGLNFLVSPDWQKLTPIAILTALGHAFFTLSLGQGTMITYGSYLSDRENISTSCVPIVFFDTIVSLLAAVAVLTVVAAAGEQEATGVGLLFATLPTVFSEITGGYFIAIAFFLLVVIAALTSQISALEPMVNYLIDEKGWRRRWAVVAVGAGAFALGIPSALSFNLLKEVTLFGATFFGAITFLVTDLLIPIGGLIAVLYVGWFWGLKKAFPYLHGIEMPTGKKALFLRRYLSFTVCFITPLLIVVVFLSNFLM